MDKILEQLWLISTLLIKDNDWVVGEMGVQVSEMKIKVNLVWRDSRTNMSGYVSIYIIYPGAEDWMDKPGNVVTASIRRMVLGNTYKRCYYLLSSEFKGYRYYLYENTINIKPDQIDSLLSYLLDECNGENRQLYITLGKAPSYSSMLLTIRPNYLPYVDILTIGNYGD